MIGLALNLWRSGGSSEFALFAWQSYTQQLLLVCSLHRFLERLARHPTLQRSTLVRAFFESTEWVCPDLWFSPSKSSCGLITNFICSLVLSLSYLLSQTFFSFLGPAHFLDHPNYTFRPSPHYFLTERANAHAPRSSASPRRSKSISYISSKASRCCF